MAAVFAGQSGYPGRGVHAGGEGVSEDQLQHGRGEDLGLGFALYPCWALLCYTLITSH